MIKSNYMMKRLTTPNRAILPCSRLYTLISLFTDVTSQQILGQVAPNVGAQYTVHSLRVPQIIIILIIQFNSIKFNSILTIHCELLNKMHREINTNFVNSSLLMIIILSLRPALYILMQNAVTLNTCLIFSKFFTELNKNCLVSDSRTLQ